MAAAYDSSAEVWAEGPELIYGRFARALAEASPIPLSGSRVLDIGAGTGAVSAALASAGARPVALDSSCSMLERASGRFAALAAVGGDALHLPFTTASFDASFSAFVLNHLPRPYLLLAEAARVTRPGGALMAMTYAAGDNHPAKAAVERAASRAGWQEPEWYREQKTWAALTDNEEGLLREAGRAGLHDAAVSVLRVDAGPLSPVQLARWRLGLAHMAEFAASLPQPALRSVMKDAEEALGGRPQWVSRELLVLSNHFPARA